MTKIEKLIKRQGIVDAAQQEIAFARGQIARACNRPNSGCLVPKFDCEAEAQAWQRGWSDVDGMLLD